ncbi:MAG TPA: hypothetical protein VHV78_12550, partial [Gemmatimonadaceae bacterium]|nr:hypothetical protein [Gemmatimonadaceae bacterium]
MHPTDPQTIYIGAAQGGVWKTANGGASWTSLTDGQCSLAMGAVAIDPVNPQIVYAGTGEQNFSADSYYGCGVLRSSDGGTTWTQLGASTFDSPSGGATISRLLIDRPTAGSTATTLILAATNAGMYRSTNSGSTWTSVLAGVVTDLIVDPSTPSTMYSAVGSAVGGTTNGIYKSVNSGASWTRLGGGLPVSNVGRINLTVAPSSPQTLYASVQDGEVPELSSFGTLLGIWASSDGGATWAKTAAATASCGASPNAQCWYDMTIAVDPLVSTTVYFGGVQLYKSIDGGATFAALPIPHTDQHALVVLPTSPATVYVGNDGGVFKSIDAGATLTSLNTNLSLTQFYGGASIDPSSATTLFGGTQDNGTLLWGGAASWPEVLGSDGGFTAIDPTNPATAYAETQWAQGSSSSGPRRRDVVGGQFITRNNGIVVSDRAEFIAPLVMDIFRPRILYFGTYRLYRTANHGDSWTPISGDLSRLGGNINAIRPASSDSNTIYVGTSDGDVQFTHDLGATWTVAAGLPIAAVSDVAVDPHDARSAYVAYHGFVASKVLKTSDGGATWTDLTLNLPNIPVLSIVLEPGSRDLDVGTDLGVFTLRNGTTSWVPLMNGLPNVAVYDLIFDITRSRLIAATHGRGMFSLDVTVTGLR